MGARVWLVDELHKDALLPLVWFKLLQLLAQNGGTNFRLNLNKWTLVSSWLNTLTIVVRNYSWRILDLNDAQAMLSLKCKVYKQRSITWNFWDSKINRIRTQSIYQAVLLSGNHNLQNQINLWSMELISKISKPTYHRLVQMQMIILVIK